MVHRIDLKICFRSMYHCSEMERGVSKSVLQNLRTEVCGSCSNKFCDLSLLHWPLWVGGEIR
jgi:hypothetical protein